MTSTTAYDLIALPQHFMHHILSVYTRLFVFHARKLLIYTFLQSNALACITQKQAQIHRYTQYPETACACDNRRQKHAKNAIRHFRHYYLLLNGCNNYYSFICISLSLQKNEITGRPSRDGIFDSTGVEGLSLLDSRP